jgi:hypothetical protein
LFMAVRAISERERTPEVRQSSRNFSYSSTERRKLIMRLRESREDIEDEEDMEKASIKEGQRWG